VNRLLSLSLTFILCSAIAGAAPAQTASVAPSGSTTTFSIFNVKVEVKPPAGWKRQEGTRVFVDPGVDNARFTFEAGPMDLPDKTLRILNESAFDQGKDRVKVGELSSCEMMEVGGLDGVLTIEASKNPSQRRMVWVTHARAHYMSFTFTAPTPVFEKYLPAFRGILASVRFLAP